MDLLCRGAKQEVDNGSPLSVEVKHDLLESKDLSIR